MSMPTETTTAATDRSVVDLIVLEHDVQVQATSRFAWTLLLIAGLVFVAYSATHTFNGLTVFVMLASAWSASRALRSHDRLKNARRRLAAW